MVKQDASRRKVVLEACCDRLAAMKCRVGKHSPLHRRISEGASRQAGGGWCPHGWGFVMHRTTVLPDGSTRTVVRSRFTDAMQPPEPRFISTFTSDANGVLQSVDIYIYAQCESLGVAAGAYHAGSGLCVSPGCAHIARSSTTRGRLLDAIIAPLGSAAVRGVGAAVLPKGIDAARESLECILGDGHRGCKVELLLRALSLASQTGVMIEDGRVVHSDPRPRIASAASRKLLSAVKSKGVYWRWREHTARQRYHPDRMRADIEAQCAKM